ncbi:unnamed protein product [Cuscuta epithymum]|uniref:Secreted protein n=1 Tax=Cuscuta epithymum TaxID=186058 RepID=A0AAV0ELF3_9ASTE|nr:unnamed protein product [Cuscuta epithymum]
MIMTMILALSITLAIVQTLRESSSTLMKLVGNAIEYFLLLQKKGFLCQEIYLKALTGIKPMSTFDASPSVAVREEV